MSATAAEIKTADGIADVRIFHPNGDGPWPPIVFYMDGLGLRDELCAMAQRLADYGYYVLLPNLYYRAGEYRPFEVSQVYKKSPEQERVMAMIRTIDNAKVMKDTAAFFDFLGKQEKVSGEHAGCLGYCMGGRFALTAAGTFPNMVSAAASIHGGELATSRPDSPHLLANRIRGKVYVGVAETDPWFLHEERDRLKSAFDAAGTDYQMEVYPDTRHGFAVNGLPLYNQEASERHWETLRDFFRASFG